MRSRRDRERTRKQRRGGAAVALRALLVLAWVACTPSWAQAPAIFPLEAVEKGLVGVGRTVVSGTQVEEFGVELLAVLTGQGPSNSLVMVRVFGPLVERTGGIAAGMSGSPVYVDGKLLGAIGYGFEMADHTIGLVTPAADMLAVLDLVGRPAKKSAALGEGASRGIRASTATNDKKDAVLVGGQLIEGVALAANLAEAAVLREQLPPTVGVAAPVATPLMIGGLSPRAATFLQPFLSRWSMMAIPAGQAVSGQPTPSLEPGAAFGVQLVRGDVNVTALGTVTHAGATDFVGFGHPFLNKGTVDLYATGAYIHEIVDSIQVPFKVGTPLDAVGRLTQDRAAGVAGTVGGEPETIEVRVQVMDRTLERTRHLRAQVVRDDSLTVPLLAATLLQAVDQALDRIGQGTARVDVFLEGEGLPGPVTRDNLFFSSQDIAVTALGELLHAVQTLLTNELSAVQLTSLSLTVLVDEERRTARVERAVSAESQVRAGETLAVEITMRPFRQEPVVCVVELQVPADTPPGQATVAVRGGGYGAPRLYAAELAAQLDEPSAEDMEESEPWPKPDASLEKLVSRLFAGEHNYDLVAELYPPYLEADTEGLYGAAPDGGHEEMSSTKVWQSTPYFVQGNVGFSIEVLPSVGNVSTGDGSNIDEEEPSTDPDW